MSYPPPAPQPPLVAPVKKPNPLGVAALVVGIVAFVGALVPIVNYFAVLIAFVGVVLGVVALVLAGRRKSAAVAGVVVSFVAIAASVVLAIVYTFVFFGGLIGWVADGANGPVGPSFGGPGGIEETTLPLLYQVDGTGSDVSVTYTTFVDDIQSTQQVTGQELPFEQSLTVGYGGADTYDSYTVTAVNGVSDGDVSCRIILDGQVLVEQSATGPYATATCTASGTDLLR